MLRSANVGLAKLANPDLDLLVPSGRWNLNSRLVGVGFRAPPTKMTCVAPQCNAAPRCDDGQISAFQLQNVSK